MPVIGRILVVLIVCAAVSLGVSNGVDALMRERARQGVESEPLQQAMEVLDKTKLPVRSKTHRRITRRAWLQMKRPFTRACRTM